MDNNIMVTVPSGVTLTICGNWSGQNGDGITVNAGGTLIITGTLDINNNFTLTSNGTVSIGTVNVNNNSGFTVSGTGSLSVTNNFTAGTNATISIASGGTMTVGGNLTVSAGSTITTNGTLSVTGTITGAQPTGSAVQFRSAITGAWSNVATWQYSTNGTTWLAATGTPTSSSGTITIRNGHNVTLGSSITIDETSINSGGTLTVSSGQTLTIANGTGTDFAVDGILSNAGTITQNASSTTIISGTYTHNQGAGTVPRATWSNGSTCNIIGQQAGNSLPSGIVNQQFHHFTWNCTNQTTSAQTLSLGSSSPMSIGGNFTVSSTGTTGYLSITGNGSPNLTIGGDLIISGGILDLTNNSGNTTLRIAGNINQSGGTLMKSLGGTGTIVFNKASGIQTFTQSAGTITGLINWDIGTGSTSNTLQLASPVNLNTGLIAGVFRVLNGSTLDFAGRALTGNFTVTINGSGVSGNGSLTNSSASAVTFANAITLGSASEIEATGGNITITGGVNNAGFLLTIDGANATTIGTSSISGSGGIAKYGVGTLTLSGGNTFTGTTTVFSGIVRLGVSASGNTNGPLGTPAGATIVMSGASLDMNGYSLTVSATEPLTINGNGVSNNGALTNSAVAGSAWIGAITLGSTDNYIGTTNGTLTISGVIDDGASTNNVTIVGTGSTWFSATNTYGGSTTINSGATLVDNKSPGTAIPDASALIVNGTFDLNGNTETVGSLAGSGSIIASGASAVSITCGGDNSNTTFSGIYSDGSNLARLIKTGSGTLTVTGANTFNNSGSSVGTGSSFIATSANSDIVITAGKIELGTAANRFSSSNAVCLNGGILSSGASTGFSQTFGRLSLTENSTINLGTGSHSLAFTASNQFTTWTADKIITVTGWQGSINSTGSSGTAGKLFVGSTTSGLTAVQLSQIIFSISGSLYPATILNTGEIVPISTRTFYSRVAGNWAVASNWAVGSHTGSIAYDFPRAGDIVYISHAMTYNASAACAEIYLDAASGTTLTALTINSPFTLDVSGSISLTSDGITNDKTNTIAGTGTINCTNLLCGNNITTSFLVNTTVKLISTVTTLNCSSTLTVRANFSSTYKMNTEFNLAAGTMTLGNLVVTTEALNALDAKFSNTGTGTLKLMGNGTVVTRSGNGGATTATETVNFTGSTVEYVGSSNQTMFATSYKGLRIANTGGIATLGGDINVGGDWDNDGTFSSSSHNVTFNGAVNQSILGDNTTVFNKTYVNNPGSTVTLTRNISATELNYNNTSGTATFSISSGVVLTINGPVTKTSMISTNYSVLTGLGTVNCTAINVGTAGTSGASVDAQNYFTTTLTNLNCTGDLTILAYCSGSWDIRSYCYLNSGTIQVQNVLLNVTPGGSCTTQAEIRNDMGIASSTLIIQGSNALTTTGAGTFVIAFDGSSSTVEYNGAAAQNVYNTTYKTLRINNPAGCSLFGNVSTTNLNLLSGILNTGVNSLTVAAGGSTSGSSTSYVNGPLTIARTSLALTPYPTFYIGKDGRYLPVTINSITSSSTNPSITIEAFSGDVGGTVSANTFCYLSTTEYWNVRYASSSTTEPKNMVLTVERPEALGDLNILTSTDAVTSGSAFNTSYITRGGASITANSLQNSSFLPPSFQSGSKFRMVLGSTKPKGGSVTPSSSVICSNSTTSLTVLGHSSGASIQWQESDDNGVTDAWASVVGGSNANSTTYTTAALTTTKYFRAALTGGPTGCAGTTYSTSAQISVNTISVPTITASSGAARCGNGTLSISATASAGTIEWFDALNSGTSLGTSNSGATWTTPSTSVTTSYYAEAVNGSCRSASRTAVSVTIANPSPTVAVASGDYIWRGVTSGNWNLASNWLAYNGSIYSVPASAPGASSTPNVIISPLSGTCAVSQFPSTDATTVYGKSVTIESGATVTMGAGGTMYVLDDWTNNGTFNSGTSTVSFNGTAVTQSITGNTTFYNLTLQSGGSTRDFGSTITTVSNNFRADAGTMTPSTSTIVLTGASGSIAGSNAKYFYNLQIDANASITNVTGGNINVSNNYTNNGTFSQSSGITFYMNGSSGANQTMSGTGTSTFGNFEIPNVASVNAGTHNFSVCGSSLNVSSASGVFNGGSSTVTFTGSCTIGTGSGTYNFYNVFISGTLNNTNNKTLNVSNSWTNNGTFSAGSGLVVFNGSNNGIIGGNVSSSFYNLTMNKTASTYNTLAQNISITNQLTLTAGNIDLGAFDADMGASSLSGGTATSYVKTSGVGVLKRTVSSSSLLFPVGNSAFNPATLTNSGTSDKFSVRVIDNVSDNGDATNAVSQTTAKAVVKRTWMISEALANGSNVSLKLNWNNGEEINSFNQSSAFIAHYESASSLWDNMGGTVGSGFITTSGLTSFSPFTVASDGSFAPLPIELISFQANCSDNNTVDITWSTASEHNTNYFRVDKSRNGTQWDVLGTIGAAGNSTFSIDYALTDAFPTPGINYYRLTQYDNDGVFETFDAQAAVCKDQQSGTALSTYPNPSSGDFNVDLQTDELEGEATLLITDAKGAVVHSQDIKIIKGNNNYVIHPSTGSGRGFEPGIYYISVRTATSTVTTKHSMR
jgi:hypothetical protein